MRLLQGLNAIRIFGKKPATPARVKFMPKPGITADELALALEAMLKSETFPADVLRNLHPSVKKHFRPIEQ